MKKIDPSVSAYFKTLDAPSRATLMELRSWILQARPHTSETMFLPECPTYVLGEVWVSYKAQKETISASTSARRRWFRSTPRRSRI